MFTIADMKMGPALLILFAITACALTNSQQAYSAESSRTLYDDIGVIQLENPKIGTQ